MKIIDEKGRFLGKINTLDFLVLLLLLCLAPIFYFGYNVFTKKPQGLKFVEDTQKVLLRVKLSNVMPELSKLIKEGDQQIQIVKDDRMRVVTNRPVAKIVKVISNKSSEIFTLDGNRKTWSVIKHPRDRDLVVEIEGLCVTTHLGLSLESNVIKIGNIFTFSTDLYSFQGVIIGIEKR